MVPSVGAGHFFKHFLAQQPAFDGQSTSLVVGQENPLLAKFLLENLILGSKVIDHSLLLTIDPAGQDEEIELPGL